MASNTKKRIWLIPATLIVWLGASLALALSSLPFTYRWLGTMITMLVPLVTLGAVITGRFAGILVDERNFMSLSRFQIVLWTVLLLSAFCTIAMARIFAPGITDPLAIAMDEHLWALLGISTAALVGTPLIHRTKEAKTPAAPERELSAAQNRTGLDDTASAGRGLLFVKANVRSAGVEDMFTGEELGDAGRVDMAKVQMFFFTAVAALTYAVALYRRFEMPAASDLGFPELSGGLIALLGISHATHLAGKIPDRTK